MFSTTIPYYDLIHSYKDYASEAQALVSVIRREHPSAKTILDVACGTGEHAKHLAMDFEVDGLDVEPEFVKAATLKVPAANFLVADMRGFNTGRKYDVILCLFSSIGYLTRGPEVIEAMTCFRSHLSDNGLLILEPWFTPDRWRFNQSWLAPAVNEPPVKLCGMTTSRRSGAECVLEFHYLIGDGSTIQYLHERHVMGMFTVAEMSEFLRQAGFESRFEQTLLSDRGAHLARPAATTG